MSVVPKLSLCMSSTMGFLSEGYIYGTDWRIDVDRSGIMWTMPALVGKTAMEML